MVECLDLEIDFTMGLKLNLERYDKMLLLNYAKLATILSKLINAKSDGTLIAHYCFRNNEMQSEVSGLRLDMERNGNFQLQLLTDSRFIF